jgi:hypothetical protein
VTAIARLPALPLGLSAAGFQSQGALETGPAKAGQASKGALDGRGEWSGYL